MAHVVKNLPATVGDTVRKPGFNPWVGRSSARGNGNPLQYSCLDNSMDRGTWQVAVHEDACKEGTPQRKTLRSTAPCDDNSTSKPTSEKKKTTHF